MPFWKFIYILHHSAIKCIENIHKYCYFPRIFTFKDSNQLGFAAILKVKVKVPACHHVFMGQTDSISRLRMRWIGLKNAKPLSSQSIFQRKSPQDGHEGKRSQKQCIQWGGSADDLCTCLRFIPQENH